MRNALIFLLLSTFGYTYGQVLYPCKQNDSWGFRNSSGDLIIKCQYDSVTPFINGISIVYREDENIIAINKKGDHLFNKPNAISMEHFYYDYSSYYKHGAMVIIDKMGNEIAEFKHLEIINDNWAIVEEHDRRGLYSIKSRKNITMIRFDFIHSLKRDTSVVFVTEYKDLLGFIDETGNEIIEPKYEYLDLLREAVPGRYKNFEMFQPIILTNLNGKSDTDYTVLENSSEKYRLISKGDLLGVINENEKLIIPCEWTSIDLYGEVWYAEYYFDDKPYRSEYFDLKGNALGNCK